MDRILHQNDKKKKESKKGTKKYVFFLLVLSALPPDPAYVRSDIMSQPAANLSVCLRIDACMRHGSEICLLEIGMLSCPSDSARD
ncbi:hypothetical protein CEXT_769651 [Caerostris extrusa]|uniref:Uncharacterized protein n=1 Tax=Caerostris extrusa TaxID=172846 RepID=A0AAV4S5A3_CAEEX|nr:hypothetical protein CEXT_769651 [Caerostris extrusa]